MKTIRRAEFESLAEVTGLCASIYLPLNPTGREGMGDALRLRELTDEVESQWIDRGVSAEHAKKQLSQIRAFPQSNDWSSRGKSMAVLLGPASAQFMQLDRLLEPEAWGDDHLHVRPLLPLVVESDQFYLLALSEHHVQLYEGDDQALRVVEVPGLPKNLDDALQLEGVERCLQSHSANAGGLGRRGAVLHGHGGRPDAAKVNRSEFVHRVASAVDHYLLGRREPLVLATVVETAAMWREESTYLHTSREFVAGNADRAPLSELRQRAWRLIDDQLASEGKLAYDRLSDAKGTSRAIVGLSQVLPVAAGGRIDTLFVDCREPVCGRFDPNTLEVAPQERIPGKRCEDLLEVAIRETLKHRGKVFSFESVGDSQTSVEAFLRY